MNAFSAMRSSRSLGWVAPMRIPVDLWTLPVQPYLDFRELCCVHRVCPCRLEFLQSMADPSGKSNFLRVVFHGVLELHVVRIDFRSLLSTFEHCGATVFQSPSAVFYLLSCVRHIWPNIWPYIIEPGCCLNFCSAAPGPRVSIWWPLVHYCDWKRSMALIDHCHHQRSNRLQCDFPATHHTSYSSA